MGAIMRAVLVGCVKIDKPDAAARTHSRALAACPRNAGNVWACREHLRVGPVWGLSREVAQGHPAPPEVTFTPSPLPLRYPLLPHSDCHPPIQGNGNLDDVTICMNNMMDIRDSVVQDFNDAQTYQKANGLSAQTGGLPLRIRCSSMIFEDRTGYQIFTVKLTAADVVTDQAKFDALPDIIMREIPTADGGPPLYIRFV